MRILLPTHQEGTGGIGRTAAELAAALPAALGEKDELIVLPGNGRSPLARLLHEQLGVARAARAVDLVHLPDHRALLASRTPVLLTVHDLFFFDRPEWFPPAVVRYKRAMLRLALRRGPAAVVCVSEFTRSRLFAHFPGLDPGRVRVIHHGVTTPPEGDRPTSDAPPYFLTVSTVEARKNHAGLLRAFRAARDRGLDLRWKVAGGAGYRSHEVFDRLRADPEVDVLGSVPDGELERLYAGALFYASPSFGEGFGMTPLEAMARGVPVVCSTGTGLDESVGDAAERVDPDDEAAWTDALLRLAGDEDLRARFATAGRAQAQRFDWARTADEYVDAYRDALG